VRCPDGHDPTTPIDYGRCALDQALAEAGVTRAISIATVGDAAPAAATLAPLVDARAESYAVSPVGDTTWIVGRDAVGAMYGALELAERLRLHGGGAVPPAATLRGAPEISIRAANLFWVLPDADQPEPDNAWWFYDEDFWAHALDLLAHARMDLLDLHGMYSLQSTGFPNILPYVARSATFPDIVATDTDPTRNLAMLNRVIAMARARGIRVALMTYSAGAGNLQGDDLKTYVREAVADLATRAPGLAMLGFRIGESGQLADWYVDSFVAGARQAATGLTIYTRTWNAPKPDILTLAAAVGPDMVLESKLNGEHLGPPYPIAGGVWSTWESYTYQGFLTPPYPWQFVFQVRAGGTHRIFRGVSFELTRRAVGSLAKPGLSPRIRGFTLEPPTAYTPQRDTYHASADDRFSPWAFPRDDLMYLMWGRLGYDPATPEATFRDIAAREAGTDGLWPALQAASTIVPWLTTAHSCGPDSRMFAPELEWGGTVADWARAFDPSISKWPACENPTPFDTFAVASPAEAAADLVAGTATSRLSPIDVAAEILTAAQAALDALAAADPGARRDNPLARDVARESRALADLGRYTAHKLRGATALAVYQRTARADWLAAARAETTAAGDAWRDLADDTAYILPFHDRLRMAGLGFDPFHWTDEIAKLAEDAAALDSVAAAVAASPPAFSGSLPDPRVWLASPKTAGPGLGDISVTPAVATAASWTVQARFGEALPVNATVRVLWKPFDSERDWVAVEASPAGDGSYTAVVAGEATGAQFAVEIRDAAGAWRYPDPRVATPYVSLPP
jgi:hypothetical protein